MTQKLKIEFVSDVSCPWCIIGLRALEQAMDRIGHDLEYDFEFKPFELNPQMAPEGQELYEHMAQKYGSSKAQSDEAREMIRSRGEDLGFEFRMDRLEKIYNTFDTHRLLHHAKLNGKQRELKLRLFEDYFTNGKNPSDHEVLAAAAIAVGLDEAAARQVLASDDYSSEVREEQAHYHSLGIHAVPAVIINDKHLIQGGQPVDLFEQALRQISVEAA